MILMSILWLFLISLVMLVFLLLISFVVSWKGKIMEEKTSYECSFWMFNNVSMYSFEFLYIVFIFLLFDLEISLVTPFFMFSSLGSSMLMIMVFFLLFLTLFLLYEVKLGVFDLMSNHGLLV